MPRIFALLSSVVALLTLVNVHTVLAQAPTGQGGTPTASPSAQPGSTDQPTAASSTRVFASDAGMVLNFIKPEKTGQFEGVVARLKEALRKSDKPERKQQAETWKVFRAVEPAGGNVLYLFTIDPAVKGADYTISTILAEAFPEDVQALYKEYAEAYATGQNFVNLTLVSALGQ